MKASWESMISSVNAICQPERDEFERIDHLVKDCKAMSTKAAMFIGLDGMSEIWIPLSLLRVDTDAKLYLINWKCTELFGV